MVGVRDRISRWFVPVLAVVVGSSTLLVVAVDPDGPIRLSLVKGALALVAAIGLFAVGYRYVATGDISSEEARTVAVWTVAGMALLVALNVWFRVVAFATGAISPAFAFTTSVSVGALGGVVTGISFARARRRATEREQAQADYRALFEAAEDGILVHDPETGTILDANPRAAEMLGVPVEDVVGASIDDISVSGPAYSEAWGRRRIRDATEGEPQQFDWLIERSDDPGLWVEVSLKRTTLGDEERVIALVRDISDRKAYERELEARSEAMEASIDGIALLGEAGRYQFVNGAHAEIYGYESADEMLGESWRICYDEAELDRFESEVMPTLFEEGGWRGEATGTRRDGSEFPQELSLATTSDDRIVCIVRDVTERKQHERQITDLHDATREMIQAADDRAVVDRAVETAETILEFPLTGVWLADAFGERLEPVATTDAGAELVDELPVYTEGNSLSWRAYESGEVFVLDELQNEPGTYNPESFLGSELIVPLGKYGVLNVGSTEPNAFSDNDVAVAKLLAANTEVALERVERERELERQADQMEFFNSILRHDVLNGITVVRGRAELLAESLDGDQRRDAEVIVKWSDDIVDVVGRVRTVLETLSGTGDPELEPVDLCSALDAELDRVRSTYPEATFETAIPDGLTVRANDLLGEVLGNVITNAADHNDTDGLVVSVTAEDHDEFVEVRIADNGRGVPEAATDAVFRRGETGHGTSSGSGFGLFFVDSMVTEYGGDVRVEENEDGGATFVIQLPAAAATGAA